MVAMGTSLADRAWGRESAVYRVAGVLSVIGGWLLTALIAFTISAIFLSILYHFEFIGLGGLLILILTSVFLSARYHKLKEKRKSLKIDSIETKMPEAITQTANANADTLEQLKGAYNSALEGLFNEDETLLKRSKAGLEQIGEALQDMNNLI